MGKKKVKEVTDIPSLFASRLRTREAQIKGSPTVFHLSGIRNTVRGIIDSQPTGTEQVIETCRYGITDIKGLVDETGKRINFEYEEQNIRGRVVKVVPYDILDGLPFDGLIAMCAEINNLSHMTKGELLKLDFTTASS